MKKRKIDPLEEIMSNPYYQLRDDYNYAEKVKGTISFGQYSMKYWALERDIVLDETKSEVTEEMFVKAIMDARKEGEILNDEDVFDSWMTEQLADCSADEAKIIKETVVNLKKSLRKVYGKSSKHRYD